MRVYWTNRAKVRLRLIHDCIAQDAPLVAPQVVARLIERSGQIGTTPYAGRQVPEYQREDCVNCSNALTASSTESGRIALT